MSAKTTETTVKPQDLKQGDVIKVDLTPVVGHEQDGYRPVLVLSNESFNKNARGLVAIMAISHGDGDFPLSIPIPAENGFVTGNVLTHQMRTLDLTERKFKKIGQLDTATVNKCKTYHKETF